MKLHYPFIITPRLLPGLEIGEGTSLSLVGIDVCATSDGRDRACFAIDFPDGRNYYDEQLRSGCQGFASDVEAFESFLGFLSAALESYPDGENADLFPAWVLERMDKDHIDYLCACLTDEKGRGIVNHSLIEEDA